MCYLKSYFVISINLTYFLRNLLNVDIGFLIYGMGKVAGARVLNLQLKIPFHNHFYFTWEPKMV